MFSWIGGAASVVFDEDRGCGLGGRGVVPMKVSVLARASLLFEERPLEFWWFWRRRRSKKGISNARAAPARRPRIRPRMTAPGGNWDEEDVVFVVES